MRYGNIVRKLYLWNGPLNRHEEMYPFLHMDELIFENEQVQKATVYSVLYSVRWERILCNSKLPGDIDEVHPTYTVLLLLVKYDCNHITWYGSRTCSC